jgi:hypothetical protein
MPTKTPPMLRPGAWVLLALLAARHHALTPVQLQKSLFLLGKRRPKEVGKGFYSFRPYDYGPFDVAVYTDADRLVGEGLVAVNASEGRSLRRYYLTPKGKTEAERLTATVPAAAMQYLQQVVPWSQKLSFNELVRAIYEAYPDMRANSVFRDPA